MGFIKRNLGKDENIVITAKESKWTIVGTIIAFYFLVSIFFYPIIKETGNMKETGQGIFVLIVIVVGTLKFLDVKCISLTLTNKRVFGKYGMIHTKRMDSPLNKVDNVSVEQGLFGKLCGYGKIVVTTPSGQYDFKYVKHPDSFRSAVMEQIDEYEEERIRKQAETLAGAIKNN